MTRVCGGDVCREVGKVKKQIGKRENKLERKGCILSSRLSRPSSGKSSRTGCHPRVTYGQVSEPFRVTEDGTVSPGLVKPRP